MRSGDLHCVLRDLMTFYHLDFKRSHECIEQYKFHIPEYMRYKAYDPEHRKIKLDEIISGWASKIRYKELVQYNNLMERINRGFDILNHTTDEAKQAIYIRNLYVLLEQHEILVRYLGIRKANKTVTLPYILESIHTRKKGSR